MIITNERLFQLTLQHEYFDDNKATRAIQLSPQILNNASSINLKGNEDGILVYRKTPGQDSETVPVVLGFPLQFTDSSFFNYTALDFQADNILYFEIDQDSTTTIDSQSVLNLKIYPSNFVYALKDYKNDDSLKTVYLEGPNSDKQALVLDLVKSPSVAKGYGITVNVADQPDGKYQLSFEFADSSKNYTDTFFVSNTLYTSPSSAVLVWKGNLTSQNTNLATYTLSFKARSVFYKYIFPTVASKKDWEDMQFSPITIGPKAIQFNKKEEAQKLANGQDGYVAVSDVAIPLRERPNWSIKLNSSQIPGGFQLPYASAQSPLKQIKENNSSTAFYSEIFVYI